MCTLSLLTLPASSDCYTRRPSNAFLSRIPPDGPLKLLLVVIWARQHKQDGATRKGCWPDPLSFLERPCAIRCPNSPRTSVSTVSDALNSIPSHVSVFDAHPWHTKPINLSSVPRSHLPTCDSGSVYFAGVSTYTRDLEFKVLPVFFWESVLGNRYLGTVSEESHGRRVSLNDSLYRVPRSEPGTLS